MLGVEEKDWLEGTASSLEHEWDCSQLEDDFEEGDVMDWLEVTRCETMGRCQQGGRVKKP